MSDRDLERGVGPVGEGGSPGGPGEPETVRLQVCGYNAAGRWAPVRGSYPRAVFEDGWFHDESAALLAAIEALPNHPRIVMRDVADCAVFTAENGQITFPPQYVEIQRDGYLGYTRDALEGRLRDRGLERAAPEQDRARDEELARLRGQREERAGRAQDLGR